MKTLNYFPSMKTVLLLIASVTTTLFAENKVTITHSFLGVGKANQVVIVGEDGKVRYKGFVPAGNLPPDILPDEPAAAATPSATPPPTP